MLCLKAAAHAKDRIRTFDQGRLQSTWIGAAIPSDSFSSSENKNKITMENKRIPGFATLVLAFA